MFTALIFFIILSKIEVFANYTGDKLTLTDESLLHFHVSSFLFNNDSIRLNITWENDFGNDSVKEIFVESYDTEGDCSYSNSYNVSKNNNIIIPSTDIIQPFETISPGCVYLINMSLVEKTLTESYTVPDCVGNYCMCMTKLTNLIRLTNVEFITGNIYKVYYTSQNTSLEKGNYYITKVFYINQNTSERFEVPELKYLKGAVEISMEYLKYGENYTLLVQYRDSNNVNPYCEYISRLSFKAQTPLEDNDHLVTTLVSIFLFFFFAFILCILLIWSFSTDTLASIKKLLFPIYEESPVIRNLEKTSFSLPNQEVNILYTPLELSEDPYEFPRENIILKEVIGEGNFGKVHYAKAYNLNGFSGFSMVAVKQLRDGASKEELADFQAEIEMLKMLKKNGFHKNVVRFLGCVTKSQPYMTIMELVVDGNLKEYLLKLRDVWVKYKNQRLFFPDDMEESLKTNEPKANSEEIMRFDANMQTPLLSDIGSPPKPILDHRELENFAHQIASGMAYLENIPVTHRDLAARNILITKEKVLKISDFGMSRCGPYVNHHLNKKVPLRWMAIEAIEDFKTDSKSDVWSFGVVLWEIGTLGAFPYSKIPDNMLSTALRSGIRLPRPEICTDNLYALMQSCWMENPNDRPTFGDIVEHFHVKKQHVYVDFKRINPKYVFPPIESK